MKLSTDSAERKRTPITTGVLDYFPLAIAEVAKCSFQGNEQHHKGELLHWDKTKSTDHADCIARHLVDRSSVDTDGVLHAAKLAWRALAFLETQLESKQQVAKEDGIACQETDWIPHSGGAQPVADEVLVKIKNKEGWESDSYEQAHQWHWHTRLHSFESADIVAYKVEKNQ